MKAGAPLKRKLTERCLASDRLDQLNDAIPDAKGPVGGKKSYGVDLVKNQPRNRAATCISATLALRKYSYDRDLLKSRLHALHPLMRPIPEGQSALALFICILSAPFSRSLNFLGENGISR